MGVGVGEHVQDIPAGGGEIAGGGEEREGGLVREVGGEMAQGALGALEPTGQVRGLLLPGLGHELGGLALLQLANQKIGRKESSEQQTQEQSEERLDAGRRGWRCAGEKLGGWSHARRVRWRLDSPGS